VISPILANVYLHYVFDLWTHRWRRKATGDVMAIRYADDTIVGFQHEHEAKAFLHDLLAKHQQKTPLTIASSYKPGALAAHAGIRTGGGWQQPSLP
jgi:retron-type reverse transcriptase